MVYEITAEPLVLTGSLNLVKDLEFTSVDSLLLNARFTEEEVEERERFDVREVARTVGLSYRVLGTGIAQGS
ncbi:MAG: hypothetical protein ACE5FT_05330 [Candidatus Nanoarchaeia archaeon]